MSEAEILWKDKTTVVARENVELSARETIQLRIGDVTVKQIQKL